MSLTIQEVQNIFLGKMFKTESLNSVENYCFTDKTVFAINGEQEKTVYKIFEERGVFYLHTELPIFGVTEMAIHVEKIKDVYLIITLLNKKDCLHVITLEQTLQQ